MHDLVRTELSDDPAGENVEILESLEYPSDDTRIGGSASADFAIAD
jgi:hypothetical protein